MGNLAIRIWIIFFAGAALTFPAADEQIPDAIPNFHKVNSWLYRGGAPGPEGIGKLQHLGIKTIISLEWELIGWPSDEIKEERDWAAKANLRFESIPLPAFWVPEGDQIERVLTLIRDPSNHPIYIHCDRGVDRTGFVIGVYRVKVEGWTSQQAYNEMVRLGFHHYRFFWWKRALFQYVRAPNHQ